MQGLGCGSLNRQINIVIFLFLSLPPSPPNAPFSTYLLFSYPWPCSFLPSFAFFILFYLIYFYIFFAFLLFHISGLLFSPHLLFFTFSLLYHPSSLPFFYILSLLISFIFTTLCICTYTFISLSSFYISIFFILSPSQSPPHLPLAISS